MSPQVGKYIKHMHKQKACNVRDVKGTITILAVDRSAAAYAPLLHTWIHTHTHTHTHTSSPPPPSLIPRCQLATQMDDGI